ncbi:hypothetical protein JKF63_04251 [Porcisia hertigi]|uniref:Flagellar attachment zone protein 1 conserved domain-containing protein n=1 Tax=Porcisia hertigi TaxID=2761500 RepID=A0A836LB84_9TRYP|nr:hypothetical protein JKF63_04251 [Porcisia hertigi]
MSRRANCIWHPMPEEVRCSSIQSRRASLAAGRRKGSSTHQPDWDVEASPTSCRDNDSACEGAAGVAHTSQEAAAPTMGTVKHLQRAVEDIHTDTTRNSVRADPVLTMVTDEEGDGVETAAGDLVKGRIRHTVRFHGKKWAELLLNRRGEIEVSFMEDIREAAFVVADEVKRLNVRMNDCMEVSFVVCSDNGLRQKEIHAALQKYTYPKMCWLYLNTEA